MKLIDLHIHTTCSDGTLSPIEIIDEAILNGLDTISITDHDTLSAYSDDLFEYAKSKGINLICGVEISTKIDKCGIHILGYNIDTNNKELNDRLNKSRNARHIYLHEVSKKLIDLGYVVDVKELDKIEAVTKAHIALNIVNNKDNEELLIKEFKTVPTKGQFIEAVMNEGCVAYVKKHTMTPKEAAELIRIAGGKVVLAHPVAYTYEDNLTVEDINKIIKDIKVDGLEAYYMYKDKNGIKHNDIDKWKKVAKDNNLFVTIGSDFHYKDNIHPGIGLVTENINITEKEIDEILNNIK